MHSHRRFTGKSFFSNELRKLTRIESLHTLIRLEKMN
jgi:hypothetical protein